ncbi:MAG TPA: GNAT family N-acetyltransferase [Fimbriimonadaceae bacterium]
MADSDLNLELLRKLQTDFIEATTPQRERYETPHTLTLFYPHSAHRWMNNTFPTGVPSPSDLNLVEEEHRRRGREPFFNYSPDLWPGVEELLADRDYQMDSNGFIMVHDRSIPLPESGATRNSRENLRESWQVCDRAFGEPEREITEEALDRSYENLKAGKQISASVLCDGRVASVGAIIGSSQSAQVVAIGTLPEYRRRGYARDVVAFLLKEYYATGGDLAWLQYSQPNAGRIYESLGFTTVGRFVAQYKKTGGGGEN